MYKNEKIVHFKIKLNSQFVKLINLGVSTVVCFIYFLLDN